MRGISLLETPDSSTVHPSIGSEASFINHSEFLERFKTTRGVVEPRRGVWLPATPPLFRLLLSPSQRIIRQQLLFPVIILDSIPKDITNPTAILAP